ncbi:hypothetical protein DGG96_09400 [Legionella qingyii]|uniref:Uncharacterized protein n=1 Tax=Legionella qingyii TaxID=2184757 RepID=A0A317U6B5_9GAMM|nr:hypothetical protein [Legionella qingyii]PWY55940.1 hypothetical protein DGG96_09400 [Legionella qingyii]
MNESNSTGRFGYMVRCIYPVVILDALQRMSKWLEVSSNASCFLVQDYVVRYLFDDKISSELIMEDVIRV